MPLLPSWLFFFALVGGALFAAWRAYVGEVHAALIVPAVTVLAGLIVLAAQRLAPFNESWRNYLEDLRVDALHAVFSTGGATTLFELVVVGWLVTASDTLSAKFGFPLWPIEWPIMAQLVLALVVAELGTYWVHRLSHMVPLLWRFHALHHSSTRLYAISSARNHPVNVVLAYVASLTPLVMLGAPGGVILLFSVFTSVHGVIQHSNIRLKMGALDWVFAGPDLHRRHHHVEVDRSNTNFGSNLIVWDLVFGTRKLIRGEDNADVGLPDMAWRPNYWQHLVSPFILRRLVRAPVDAVETVVHATGAAARRTAEKATAAGRRVAEATNELCELTEPRLAEASASGAWVPRFEDDR